MGSEQSQEMSEDIIQLATEIFHLMDSDGNGELSKEEVSSWWGKHHSVINTRAMFEAVDKDHSEAIEISEWISFWKMIKANGNTEDSIRQELLNLKEKKPWTIVGSNA